MQVKDSISLQKSRYIMVESTEEGLADLAYLKTYVLEKKISKNPRERKKNLEDLPLELRFCKNDEVNMKRHKFIIFKETQYVKHDHMKNIG